MDYRKFLGKKETLVLPVLDPERRSLNAPGRRLRLLPARTGPGHGQDAAPPLQKGWWRFVIEGRGARPEAPCEAPPLDDLDLPAVRGHLLLFSDRPGEAHLMREGAVAEPLHLLPEEDPPLFSPCLARRWHGGELIFASLEFETGPEEAARLALEEGRSLAQERGVPATLRAAFGFALARTVSRAAQVPLSPLEVRGRVLAIAEEGRPAAEALVAHLVEERERAARAAQQGRDLMITLRAVTQTAALILVGPMALRASLRRQLKLFEQDSVSLYGVVKHLIVAHDFNVRAMLGEETEHPPSIWRLLHGASGQYAPQGGVEFAYHVAEEVRPISGL